MRDEMLRIWPIESFAYEITGAVSEEDLGTGGTNATASSSGALTVGAGLRRVIDGVMVSCSGSAGNGVILFRKSATGAIIGRLRHANSIDYSTGEVAWPGADGDEITITASGVTGSAVYLTISTHVEPI